MVGQVQQTIAAMRKLEHTGRAHVMYTQHGYLNGSHCDNNNEFLRFYKQRNMPTQCEKLVVGTHGWDLIEALSPSPTEVVIHKEAYDAFHATELHSRLQERGVNTVVIAGWDTNVCCESTARSAFAYNYRVVFLSDGTGTDMGEDLREATLKNMQLIVAEVMTS